MNNTNHPAKQSDKNSSTVQNGNKVTAYGRSEIHSGPLPHPDILNRYDEIIPGAAERILKMAENEQNSRLSMDKKSTINAIIMAYLGIIFAFCAVILLSGLVYYALTRGFDTTAGAISVGAIAAVASVFMFFRRNGKKS